MIFNALIVYRSHTHFCSPTGKSDCISKVKLGAPSEHKPQLEEKKRGTPFQEPAYQELSLDIEAPSQDLAKTLPRAFQYKDHTIKH